MPRSPLRAVIRAEHGVAAVEFALIVPILLAIFVGGSELSRAVMNNRRVTQLARTVADLTSFGDATNPMAQTTMDDIFASATLVLLPFDASGATVRVSAIGIAMSGTTRTVTVCSSKGLRIAPRPVGAAEPDLVIPATYATNGMRLIVAEVTMRYQPMMGTTFANVFAGSDGSFPLKKTVIWPTRGGARPTTTSVNPEVILPGGAACP